MTAQRDPYVRVYYSIVDDPKFAGMKLETKGAWLDLLLAADAMYPAPAPLPRWLPKRIQAELVQRGLVDLEGTHHFRIHGLESERSKRSAAGKAGADARWNAEPERGAMRSHSGASMRSDALRSAPSNSAPLRSAPTERTPDDREGLPHLSEHPEVAEAGTEIVGIGFSSVIDKAPATELDRLVEFHGTKAVIEAMRAVANGQRKSWPQVIYGARNRLETIPRAPSTTREADETKAARESTARDIRRTQQELEADPFYQHLRGKAS